ncbi:head-tail adaptor protein [Plesiomonas shigelloides subsp. oncorhynchi]|nr:head-tail adaptor protein [Plesiomonas shigelloides]
MNAGDLSRRASIQRKTSGRDAAGAALPPSWEEIGVAWCGVSFISSSSVFATNQDKTISVYLLTLRKRRGILVKDRLLIGGTAYHVISIDDSMPDRTLLRTQTDVIDDKC